MKVYWFVIIIVICIMGINFRISNEELKCAIVSKNIKLKKYKIAHNNYNKHKKYIMLHSEELGFINLTEFKTSIKSIAKLSGITELNICSVQDDANCRNVSLRLKSTEQNCYKFMYFCERIINGVLDIQEVNIKPDGKNVEMKLKAKITYFDIQFKHSTSLIKDKNKYIKSIQDDMKKHCNIHLFEKRIAYKLNGIIGNAEIINGKIYNVGACVEDAIVHKINRLSIVLKLPNQKLKNVDLGGEF